MRRLFILLLLIILISTTSYSGTVIRGSGGGGGSCDTVSSECTAQEGESSILASYWYYNSSTFTADETASICAVELLLQNDGSPSGNYKVGIYDNNAGEPGSLLGDWSDSYAVSTLPASYEYVKLELNSSASISSGGTYHIVVYHDGGHCEEVIKRTYSDCLVGDGTYGSDNGSSWSSLSSAQGLKFNLYK